MTRKTRDQSTVHMGPGAPTTPGEPPETTLNFEQLIAEIRKEPDLLHWFRIQAALLIREFVAEDKYPAVLDELSFLDDGSDTVGGVLQDLITVEKGLARILRLGNPMEAKNSR